MMLRLFCVLSLLLLVSGPAAAIDGVSHSDACACSISHAHGMLPRTIDEDDPWVISLGNRGRQLYVGIEVFEYDEFGQGSLASSLLGYLFRTDVRHKGDITYLRLGGRPAAYVEVTSRYEGTAFRQRRYVVDAGDRLLIVSVFGSNRLWYDNAERVDDLLATLTVDPVANLSDPFGWSVDLLPGTLAEARAQHTVKTVAPRYQRILERAPDNVPYSRVSYDTELGEMVMYRSALPEDGLSPAVVWLPDLLTADPNGRIWEESGQDVMSAEAFREAGIVVTVPTFRGMARNPGEHEYFYGEVDDLLAAIDAVRAMPGVDPERVYLAGVGHGGTLALLATSSGAPVRGTLTYNANPWLFPTMAAGGFSRQPWDVTDAHATELRSPIHWADDLSAPVLMVSGAPYLTMAARHMQSLAAQGGKTVHVTTAPYTELRSTLGSVRDVWAQTILSDTGATFDPDVDEEDLHEAAIDRYGRRVGVRR